MVNPFVKESLQRLKTSFRRSTFPDDPKDHRWTMDEEKGYL